LRNAVVAVTAAEEDLTAALSAAVFTVAPAAPHSMVDLASAVVAVFVAEPMQEEVSAEATAGADTATVAVTTAVGAAAAGVGAVGVGEAGVGA
jgi:hypothetical protein